MATRRAQQETAINPTDSSPLAMAIALAEAASNLAPGQPANTPIKPLFRKSLERVGQ